LAVGAGEEIRGFEEDRGALLPVHARPVVPRLERGLDRAIDLLRPALVPLRQLVLVVVRHRVLRELAGLDLLAADACWDGDRLARHAVELTRDRSALGCAG